MAKYKLLLNRSATPSNLLLEGGTQYTIIVNTLAPSDAVPEITIVDSWYTLPGRPSKPTNDEKQKITYSTLRQTRSKTLIKKEKEVKEEHYDTNPKKLGWFYESMSGFVACVVYPSSSSSSSSTTSRTQQKKSILDGEIVFIANAMSAFVDWWSGEVLPRHDDINVTWNIATGRGPEQRRRGKYGGGGGGKLEVMESYGFEEFLEDQEMIREIEGDVGGVEVKGKEVEVGVDLRGKDKGEGEMDTTQERIFVGGRSSDVVYPVEWGA